MAIGDITAAGGFAPPRLPVKWDSVLAIAAIRRIFPPRKEYGLINQSGIFFADSVSRHTKI